MDRIEENRPNSRRHVRQAPGAPIELDALDRRLLRALQVDNRLSFAELAKRVASSAASCIRRVARLRAEGVIVADVALVDPALVGKPLSVVVSVELESERLDIVEDFKKSMRAAVEVTQCYLVAGETDFILLVSVADIDAFEAFAKAKLYANPNVRKFRSMISLDRVKFEPRVWL